MRQNLIKIKQEVESEVKGCKIMIYDPTHPRKNITLSITGISSVIDETRESIINKLQNLEGVCLILIFKNFFIMVICFFKLFLIVRVN